MDLKGKNLLLGLIQCSRYGQLFLRVGLDFLSLAALRIEFARIDTDNTSTIDIDEFLQHFCFTFKTPLVKKVFGAFDLNGSNDLDFAEFVVCAWNYGTCSPGELNAYFFDMYDTQRRGRLPREVIMRMIVDAYGDHHRDRTCDAALERAGFMGGRASYEQAREMSKTQFVAFARDHPALFFPMATLQRQLRAKIGPRGFWKQQTKVRARSFVPFRPSLADLQRLFTAAHYLETASMVVHLSLIHI